MSPIILMFALLLFVNTSWVLACVLILLVVVLFLANLIIRQESILYVPDVAPGMHTPLDNPEGLRSPADSGLTYEDVHMDTADGLRIHAWFIPVSEGSSTAPTLLFCHANAGNIGLRVPNFAQIVEKLHANIFALEYRGYGHSEGSPTEEGLMEDALSSWQWLRSAANSGRIDGQKIFVFGRSLGGAVSVALAWSLQMRGESPPRGLILENTFVSIGAVVDAMFPFLAYKPLKKRFLRVKWETIERIKNIEVPLLFLSGQKDEIIPPWHTKALHTGATKSPVNRVIEFPEGQHNDTWEKGGSKYWEVQADFIKECLSSNSAAKCSVSSTS